MTDVPIQVGNHNVKRILKPNMPDDVVVRQQEENVNNMLTELREVLRLRRLEDPALKNDDDHDDDDDACEYDEQEEAIDAFFDEDDDEEDECHKTNAEAHQGRKRTLVKKKYGILRTVKERAMHISELMKKRPQLDVTSSSSSIIGRHPCEYDEWSEWKGSEQMESEVREDASALQHRVPNEPMTSNGHAAKHIGVQVNEEYEAAENKGTGEGGDEEEGEEEEGEDEEEGEEEGEGEDEGEDEEEGEEEGEGEEKRTNEIIMNQKNDPHHSREHSTNNDTGASRAIQIEEQQALNVDEQDAHFIAGGRDVIVLPASNLLSAKHVKDGTVKYIKSPHHLFSSSFKLPFSNVCEKTILTTNSASSDILSSEDRSTTPEWLRRAEWTTTIEQVNLDHEKLNDGNASVVLHTTCLVNMKGENVEYLQGIVTPQLLYHIAEQNASLLTTSNRKMAVARMRNMIKIGPFDVYPHTFDAKNATYQCDGNVVPSRTTLRRHQGGNVFRMHQRARNAFERR